MDYCIKVRENMAANSFPALEVEKYDGWLLRFSAGYTYRGNCVVPLEIGNRLLLYKVAWCEKRFLQHSLPTVFKLNDSVNSELDNLLRIRKYVTVKQVLFMEKCLTNYKTIYFRPDEIEIFSQFNNKWFENILQFLPMEESRNINIWQHILNSVNKKTLYLQAKAGMKCVGSCIGVIDGDYVGIFSLHVDKNFQRQGIATKLCHALISMACKFTSVNKAYLQVENTNYPAISLYEQLGFKNYYKYWFREKRYTGCKIIAD